MSDKRCRVCLVPENEARLSDLLEDDGDKAILFEKLFGISVSFFLLRNAAPIINLQFQLKLDDSDVLICEQCSDQVDRVHEFIDNARQLDLTFFKKDRLLKASERFVLKAINCI